ncbi:major facilitator transporter [Campylobacter sputorum subsp. bubulus]|uniref:Major facilitator transporter n=1 Tax=Campylobacter sputorum subsp. sputorum TaxID=32024 RepID=A0A381DL42_9BACT|nr:MFS transporter [Campylobacter sputorum]ASM34671.1 H+ antiporter protein, major facilitator superfamily [Campylobacter sputorum aubsp. sputorum RM3237]KAB0581767.1 MFS transporter [Campylobacter sputorum subsp. sputorum]QEL04862.1 proton antiporter protein, major facilitator superfamily [Campylobacter sputorum subsp. sputorum]SUX09891.1 major facilitator transporter [Campylobacter sputorum subsp. bubulus]SUX11348.1 major facilitator transporter [Campylobacter sputorum subsp. sputorum]
MKKYLALLRTHRNFRLLCAVQIVCYFGAWFSHTGIFTMLINLNAPIWAISLCAAMAYIPCVILAPFSGILVDKFSPKPMLVTMMIIETITIIMLLFIDSLDMLWLLLVIIFVRMGVGGIYFQVEMSILPKILKNQTLKLANEIHSIIWAGCYTAGMAGAGVYIYFFGVKSAFMLDIVLYIISFYFLYKLVLPSVDTTVIKPVFIMFKNGIIYIKNNKLIMHLILLHSFVGITSYEALIALLADYEYAHILSIPLIIGFMNAIRALSLIMGPTLLSKFTNNKTIMYMYFGQGIGIIIWAFLQFNFYLGFIGLLTAGFFTSTLWSYTYTLVQRNCDEQFYGRVIAYNDMVILLVSAMFSMFVGFMFKASFSLQTITIIMGSIFFIGGIYYYLVNKFYTIK